MILGRRSVRPWSAPASASPGPPVIPRWRSCARRGGARLPRCALRGPAPTWSRCTAADGAGPCRGGRAPAVGTRWCTPCPATPAVAERGRVGAAAGCGGTDEVELEVLPGLSFASWPGPGGAVTRRAGPAWSTATASGRAPGAPGPLLVTPVRLAPGCSPTVKLALLEELAPGHPDHRCSPASAARRAGVPRWRWRTLDRGAVVTRPPHLRLRRRRRRGRGRARRCGCWSSPSGCAARGAARGTPSRTTRSLTRYLLEEAYEVVDAVEALPGRARGPGPGGSGASVEPLDDRRARRLRRARR